MTESDDTLGEQLRPMIIMANVIGLVYNVPQVILTIRTKSANDLSLLFISMRLVSAALWLIYTSILWSPDVFLSWIITGGSSTVLLYYKVAHSTREQLCAEFSWCRRRMRPAQAIELRESEEERPGASV
jgi:uncharacterized protein with PQ loop repeat